MSIFSIFAMKPAESGKVADTSIYAIRNQRNCLYLIKSSDGYIMIDAGSNVKKIKQKLAEFEIVPSDVKSIFLTHSDYDHTAGLTLFSDARIYMSEDELQMINGMVRRSSLLGYNALPNRIKADSVGLLKNKQQLILGDRVIECVKAPGHTLGSMIYLLDGKYLFTGDAFSIINGTAKIHPFTMDSETAGISIKDLYEVIKKSEIVITSHYGFYMSNDLK